MRKKKGILKKGNVFYDSLLSYSHNKRSFTVYGPRSYADILIRSFYDFSQMLKKIFYSVLFLFGSLVLGGTILFGSIFFIYYKFLPTPALADLRNIQAKGASIYDRNGVLLYDLQDGAEHKRMKLSEVPDTLIKATLAVEDKDFYNHRGFDPRGITRAALNNFTNNDNIQGGSTITQQLVKNTIVGNEVSINRKIKELALAVKIDRDYEKNDVLEAYLNDVFYGNNSWGISEASDHYFNKTPAELTLSESALIASLPTAPTRYSPLSSIEIAKERQSEALNRMVNLNYITPEEAEKAEKEPIIFSNFQNEIKAPHFVMKVLDMIADEFGEEEITREGFKIYTTLDLAKQEAAEDILARQVKSLANQNVSNGALVSMDPKTGEILSYVGGANWFDDLNYGKVNNAEAKNQPGSAIKPFVYLKAFQTGMTTGTVLHDKSTDFGGGYKPRNYDGKFRGNVLPRRALSNSLNIPAVEVLKKVGVESALDTLRSFGINTLADPTNYGLSLVLGGGDVKLTELVFAYSVLANNGVKQDPNFVIRIENSRGEIVKNRKDTVPQKVIEPEYAYLITNILSDNNARIEIFGPNSPLKLSRPAAAKTGTTDDYKDCWTIGFTPELVTGVWIGNPNNAKMGGVAGAMGAAPIWHDFMEAALKNTPPSNFEIPANIVSLNICLDGKKAATGGIQEVFIKGTEPTAACNILKNNNNPKKAP
ncbi:TPA: penicillin-binding protein [candidate division CPR2 bacterium]|uniref:Uncharacterized protein n=1 Tax=candidate division CPR2 bacterium GW2011_GWC1_41_48 TaxID=1618344 RepID=A0A0G0WA84_UNCC2|nr:MAG: hypothetical protein UT47_C0001G0305 [candidate division CPR2 bacterium GW2011_GWC2_39_35]KKR28857.1 MAG: hypothetical protein UT60_C0011G0023 [candidate division CPR2 bacterium GW2011_GWD2_39_7]KKR29389.1 MAG: hypothetical protein UT59_C0008G0005 [candidate division CPR2 bacterium GW2011_GWD1_39_7]KKS09900.1 MAG: hypothetical protein UU65_C0001G0305 [candidate division CPR2 bacterium GW2011_GWC1_41_48]OGB62269.1 MAG: hypothetical protein A2Y27_00075 [candidate division CPR2 bacterium G